MGLNLKPCTSSILLSVMGVAALLGLGLLGYFLTSPSHAESFSATGCTIPEEKCDIRLSPHVLPIHYELYLHPNFDEGTFTGNVGINITLLESVDHIRLHVKYLNVSSTTLRFEGNKSFISVKGYENPQLEYWVVKGSDSSTPFPPGNYQLSLQFCGSLTRDITGIYRSSYTDPRDNGTKKHVVSTKFQPTFARKAFPCFDEPGFKSTFSLSLVKPSHLVAISNMPVEQELSASPEKGLTTVRFAKSAKMVTYLLALAIGDLAHIETRTKRGIPVRIYTTSFAIQNGAYASSVTAGMVDFYEDYFGIPYPLPKMDIVGIPDFVSGAMEHWGMVSFRESNLLYQPGVGSAANKQRVASVIGHELAHMWFGNLMTLKWWDDLWLNEGFASYIEYKGINAVEPGWQIESQFVAEDLVPVLGLDGQLSSHPIVQEVKHPNQITELFDKISYAKGASVIRMLENFMGPAAFRAGVSSFLQKYSFSNAETKDLWDSLQKQTHSAKTSSVNISLVMDTWTRQMGYPLLKLEQYVGSGTWTLSQQRFLDDRDSSAAKSAGIDKPSPFGYRWEIPVGLEWSNGKKMVWMPHDSDTATTLPVDPTAPWIKLNTGGFGYYRVLYPENMYSKLKSHVMTTFTPAERCGLIDDAFVLAYSYYLKYNVTLEFSQFLKMEESYIPWNCARGSIAPMGRLFEAVDPQSYVLFKKYVLDLVSNMYEKLSWSDTEDDPHLDRLLKPLIFGLACEYGHKGCLSKTRELFTRWIAQPKSPSTKIASGLRDLVYKWGMYQAGLEEWNRLLEVFRQESDPQEGIRLLRSLCNVQDVSILTNFLELAKNESLVRRQDYFSVFQFYSVNQIANPIIWDFYRNEYENLLKRFTLGDRTFGRAILSIVYSFATDEKLKEVEDFFAKYPDGGAGTRARQTALENIRTSMAWAKKNSAGITEWLRKTYHT